MKILIHGVTNDRGLPLAAVLRHYGRHSVVGIDPEPAPPGGHPNPELREMEMRLPRLPIAPNMEVALREGDGLVIVASRNPVTALEHLAQGWEDYDRKCGRRAGTLAVVVVTPGFADRPRLVNHPKLALGAAPFSYDQRYVIDRLLTLKEIRVRRLTGAQGLLHAVVTEAWRWVDNMIPILETT